MPMELSADAWLHFRRASETTRYDAAPVLSFLSRGFETTYFSEVRPRIWVGIIKPSAKLAGQFSLRLEYLVVGNGFPEDLQQRTFLQLPPEHERYRVDSTLRFVASPAPHMKAACAAWASQHRIAIVPIESNKLEPEADDAEDQLFKLLGTALWRRDIFDDPDPVTEPSEFFGREQQVQQIMTKCLLGQSLAIFGLRKIGKTSLLRRVEGILGRDDNTIHLVTFIQCNATKFKSGRWWTAVFEMMNGWASAINRRAEKVGSGVNAAPRKLHQIFEDRSSTPADADVAEAFEKDLDKLRRAARQVARDSDADGVRFVAIFDEVDELYPTARDAGYWRRDYFELWNTLQAVKRGLDEPTEIVYLLGGVNPMGVESGAIEGRPNPLFELSSSYLGLEQA